MKRIFTILLLCLALVPLSSEAGKGKHKKKKKNVVQVAEGAASSPVIETGGIVKFTADADGSQAFENKLVKAALNGSVEALINPENPLTSYILNGEPIGEHGQISHWFQSAKKSVVTDARAAGLSVTSVYIDDKTISVLLDLTLTKKQKRAGKGRGRQIIVPAQAKHLEAKYIFDVYTAKASAGASSSDEMYSSMNVSDISVVGTYGPVLSEDLQLTAIPSGTKVLVAKNRADLGTDFYAALRTKLPRLDQLVLKGSDVTNEKLGALFGAKFPVSSYEDMASEVRDENGWLVDTRNEAWDTVLDLPQISIAEVIVCNDHRLTDKAVARLAEAGVTVVNGGFYETPVSAVTEEGDWDDISIDEVGAGASDDGSRMVVVDYACDCNRCLEAEYAATEAAEAAKNSAGWFSGVKAYLPTLGSSSGSTGELRNAEDEYDENKDPELLQQAIENATQKAQEIARDEAIMAALENNDTDAAHQLVDVEHDTETELVEALIELEYHKLATNAAAKGAYDASVEAFAARDRAHQAKSAADRAEAQVNSIARGIQASELHLRGREAKEAERQTVFAKEVNEQEQREERARRKYHKAQQERTDAANGSNTSVLEVLTRNEEAMRALYEAEQAKTVRIRANAVASREEMENIAAIERDAMQVKAAIARETAIQMGANAGIADALADEAERRKEAAINMPEEWKVYKRYKPMHVRDMRHELVAKPTVHDQLIKALAVKKATTLVADQPEVSDGDVDGEPGAASADVDAGEELGDVASTSGTANGLEHALAAAVVDAR